MAADWNAEMREMFDRLQRALTEEIRNQFLASEARLDERISHRLQVQAEELREIVGTAAGNYGGVLDGIHRDLADLRQWAQTKTTDTDDVLANHLGRIVALERITGVVRE
jgi:hypothetical protein